MMLTMMVSIGRLKFVAKAHVKRAYDKEQDYSSDKDEVVHELLGKLEPNTCAAAHPSLSLIAQKLARPLAEKRVKPVHAGDYNDSRHNDFAHN